MRRPDHKEIAHLICLSIRSDIDPRDADKAAGEIIAYLKTMIDHCEKCGCELNGEAALIEEVDEQWCHPCADDYVREPRTPAGSLD